MLARQPKESAGTMDITGGLPRVTEIFEARKPKDPAVLAEISGTVELRSDKRRGKMTINIKNETGMEKEHHVPQDKELQVHAGDYVEAGDPLIRGPIIPHDILRIKGEEALYQYLLTEVQNVYRSQGVKINDKHIEIILNQMLRKVKVEDAGDTKFLPGEVVDKFRFRQGNEDRRQSVKIADAGGTDFKEGDVVLKTEFKEANEAAEAAGKEPAKAKKSKDPRSRSPLRPRQDAAAGHHQGEPAERVVHLGRQLPGDHQGPYRSRLGRHGRYAGRPQGERHPRPPDPRGHGVQPAPEPEDQAPGRAADCARARADRPAPARAARWPSSQGKPGRNLTALIDF